MLISNDKMRDHIFQLLAPKYFHKWKQRHQVGHPYLMIAFASASQIRHDKMQPIIPYEMRQ